MFRARRDAFNFQKKVSGYLRQPLNRSRLCALVIGVGVGCVRSVTEKEEKVPQFSVMQYNILGKIYADPKWFPLHREKFVSDWNIRGQKLSDKILEFQPDIVCLEELDEYEFFKKKFGATRL